MVTLLAKNVHPTHTVFTDYNYFTLLSKFNCLKVCLYIDFELLINLYFSSHSLQSISDIEPMEVKKANPIEKKRRTDPLKKKRKTTFSCSNCEKTFARKFNLNRHRRRQHAEVAVDHCPSPKTCKSFSCETCHKTFNRCANLRRHVRTLHPNHVPVSDAVPLLPTQPVPALLVPPAQPQPALHDEASLPATQPVPALLVEVQPPVAQPGPAIPVPDAAPLPNNQVDPPVQRFDGLLGEDPEVFPVGINGEPPNDDPLNLFREHWASIRTHHITGRPIQNIYNFRLVGSRTLGHFSFINEV